MLVEINGSYGEGGGQLLRTAVTLSGLTGKPIRVLNVRKRRKPPGLKRQHICAIDAVAQLSSAEVKNLRLYSEEIEFYPNSLQAGEFKIDIETAGSIGLVLQALLPVAAFAPRRVAVELHGGTAGLWAPTVTYLSNVLLPVIRKMGFKGFISLLKPGFYPKGGGLVKAVIEPITKLDAISLTELGFVKRIRGFSYSGRLVGRKVAARQAEGATKTLEKHGFYDVNIESVDFDERSLSPGSCITIWAETSTGAVLGSSALGKRGKPAELVGTNAAMGLIRELKRGMPVDKNLSDQLLTWLALSDGVSEIRVTELTQHALTCIYVIRKLLKANFEIEGKLGERAIIRCEGVGFRNRCLQT